MHHFAYRQGVGGGSILHAEDLREHGGHAMRYFGRWTITSFEGDAH